ncbi:MAG: PorV/PorQ family protein [Elusimicrobiota bacterium]
MKNQWVLAIVIITAPSLRAGSFNSAANGTTVSDFLRLGTSARALAMGGAFSALVDDASANFWNPAALTNIPSQSATFMHAAYINSSTFDYGAYGHSLGRYGALGVDFKYFSVGKEMTQTDALGSELGSFKPYDLAASVGYAYKLKGLEAAPLGVLNGFSLGLALKFVQSRILTTAKTSAVDIGVLSPRYFNDRLKLALTATNIGGPLRYEQASESLPLTFTAGSAFKIKDRWLSSLDIIFPRSGDPVAAMGTEYWLPTRSQWEFAGRAGFNTETINSIDGLAGFSMGTAVGFGDCRVDYAFVPMGGLGLTQWISLTYKFSPKAPTYRHRRPSRMPSSIWSGRARVVESPRS